MSAGVSVSAGSYATTERLEGLCLSNHSVGSVFGHYAIEDQQLVLDEHGLGHHGTGAAGTGEPGDGRQQMQKQDGHIAHGTILEDREILRNAHESAIRHAHVAMERP